MWTALVRDFYIIALLMLSSIENNGKNVRTDMRELESSVWKNNQEFYKWTELIGATAYNYRWGRWPCHVASCLGRWTENQTLKVELTWVVSADNMNKLSTNQWLAIKANAQCWLDHVHDSQWKTKAMISSYLQLDYITISEPIARKNDALDTQVRSAMHLVVYRCVDLLSVFDLWIIVIGAKLSKKTFIRFLILFGGIEQRKSVSDSSRRAWLRSRRDKTRKRSLTFNLHFRRAFVAARMANSRF